jgi:hypothetical protein
MLFLIASGSNGFSGIYLTLVRREPPERALLALAQRDPVLDARLLDGVQQVLRLEGEVRPATFRQRESPTRDTCHFFGQRALEDQNGLGDREERDRAHR